MTIKTVHLGGFDVVLRKGFEPLLDGRGVPVADRDGQPVHVAEVVVPGRVTSRYAVEVDRPDTVRLRVVGRDPGHAAGTVVRLGGRVTATVWYQARARGVDARSDLTITAERVEVASAGSAPLVRGGLPAVLPADVPAMFLGQADDGTVDLMLAAVGSYAVDGLAEVRCTSAVPVELYCAEVVPVGLRAYFVAPDREDVGQRSKAELVLVCASFERAPSSNGKARKPVEPAGQVEVAGS